MAITSTTNTHAIEEPLGPVGKMAKDIRISGMPHRFADGFEPEPPASTMSSENVLRDGALIMVISMDRFDRPVKFGVIGMGDVLAVALAEAPE